MDAQTPAPSVTQTPSAQPSLEDLQTIVSVMIAFANACGQAAADGRLSLGDALYFLKPLLMMSGSFHALPGAEAELSVLKPEDIKAIGDNIVTNLDIPQAHMAEMIKNAITVGSRLAAMYQLLK